MSSIAILSGIYRRENPDRSSKVRRIFVLVICGLAFVLALELVFHLVISPRLTITRVQIAADKGLNLTDSEILDLAGIEGDTFFYALDETAVAERLLAYAPVRSATVEKIFPNAMKITIEQRVPLVVCLIEVGGATVPIALDEEGVVFQIGASVEEIDLPVISGLTFAEVELGQRLHRSLLGFLQDLNELKNSSPLLFSLISEVKFVKKNRTSFEVLLYPRDYRTKIRLGTSINASLLKEILLVLDVFESQGVAGNLTEIDFRTDAPMARFGEE